MLVLFINQYYKPDTAATGQLLADVAEEMACQGDEVYVICSRRCYSGTDNVLPRRETINGVHIQRVGASGFGRASGAGRLLDWFSFYVLAMLRAFQLPKMDVCVCLTTPPFISLIGLLLYKVRGTQNIVWMMDVYPEIAVAYGVMREKSLVVRLFRSINSMLYRKAAAIIALGGTMKHRLIEAGAPPEKVTVVHNWVPGEALSGSDGISVGQSQGS